MSNRMRSAVEITVGYSDEVRSRNYSRLLGTTRYDYGEYPKIYMSHLIIII